jgi:Peptidase propeptide and YPEB domain
VNELFGIALWAALLLRMGVARSAARDVFGAQSVRLARVMRKIRQGLVPVALIAAGFAPFTQAHSMPGPVISGSSVEEQGVIYEVPYDGMSLDDAVRMAEAQYRARVVRTDVQDEDGRKVYVLKLLSDGGRVITVRIDAATGRMR